MKNEFDHLSPFKIVQRDALETSTDGKDLNLGRLSNRDYFRKMYPGGGQDVINAAEIAALDRDAKAQYQVLNVATTDPYTLGSFANVQSWYADVRSRQNLLIKCAKELNLPTKADADRGWEVLDEEAILDILRNSRWSICCKVSLLCSSAF